MKNNFFSTAKQILFIITLFFAAMNSRSVDCIQGGRAVGAGECADQTMPATTQTYRAKECVGIWVLGDWSQVGNVPKRYHSTCQLSAVVQFADNERESEKVNFVFIFSELGSRQFFSFATPTTRQRNRASVTRKHSKNV